MVDKPAGWSSFDVVAKIRGILGAEIRNLRLENSISTQITSSKLPISKVKVGHTGTLDPLATGLMIVVVGSYCKRAYEFSKLDKVYEVQMKLGETSTTGDQEGEKETVSDKVPKRAEIEAVLQSFLGESMQTPPAFSAIKIEGKRAYQLARAGKEVKIEPRPINIFAVTLNSYAYPYVDFTVQVSSGTYIRSLVKDMGENLGTGAYMSSLRRTKVGEFNIEQAIDVKQATCSKILTDY